MKMKFRVWDCWIHAPVTICCIPSFFSKGITMPLIIVTSPSEKSGRTSLVVNLGFGLLAEGKTVNLYDLGLPPGDLRDWADRAVTEINQVQIWGEGRIEELIKKTAHHIAEPEQWILVDLDWRRVELARALVGISDCLLATVLLRELNIEGLLEFEEETKMLRSGRGIDLVVPTLVNAHNWAENEPGMMSLFEHFDEERIADPLPF